MAHRFVQLSGHVRSEYALHGQSCSLLAPVTCSLNIHALILLDDNRSPCATQEVCKTENEKQCRGYTWSGDVQHFLAGPAHYDSPPSHQRAWYPRTYLWMVVAACFMRKYFLRASQQRIVFWMRMQAARSLSARSFSRYATCPARKKILVFPNWYLSGSYCKKLRDNYFIIRLTLSNGQNSFFYLYKSYARYIK